MKVKFKKQDKHEWHKKIAWLPTAVEDSEDKYTYVWLEKYMRRQYRGHSSWEKYSKKEWFRKKLAGDFDEKKETGDGIYIGGSASSTTLVAGSGISSNTGGWHSFTIPNSEAEEDAADDDQLLLDFGDEDYTAEIHVQFPIERNYKL